MTFHTRKAPPIVHRESMFYNRDYIGLDGKIWSACVVRLKRVRKGKYIKQEGWEVADTKNG